MSRFWLVMAVWTMTLVLGFAVIFFLGQPLPTTAQQLDAAYHPTPPVSQAAAEQSAATIVRLEYPDLVNATRSVDKRTDFNVERYVIVYADRTRASGVRISIAIASGEVAVSSFP